MDHGTILKTFRKEYNYNIEFFEEMRKLSGISFLEKLKNKNGKQELKTSHDQAFYATNEFFVQDVVFIGN